MKGVSASIDEFAEREDVADLRADLEYEINEANKSIEQKRTTDLEEKEQMREFASQDAGKLEEIWEDLDGFRSKILEFKDEKCI